MSVWDDLAKAQENLKKGKLVVIPTETVYGLAAPINQARPIREIFRLKERPFFDPLIVHIGWLKQIPEIAEQWDEVCEILAKAFWPGPLSLVVQKKESLNSMITAGLSTVAIRMPKHPLSRRLIRSLNCPLAAPSANRFGKTSPTQAEHPKTEFGKDCPFVLDGGVASIGLESTVLKWTPGELYILRPGAVTPSQIQAVLEKHGKSIPIRRANSQESPGHTQEHYRPDTPLVVLNRELDDATTKQIATELKLSHMQNQKLELPNNAGLAARQLYQKLRELSDQKLGFIWINRQAYPQDEYWEAIWNRIERAASFKEA